MYLLSQLASCFMCTLHSLTRIAHHLLIYRLLPHTPFVTQRTVEVEPHWLMHVPTLLPLPPLRRR